MEGKLTPEDVDEAMKLGLDICPAIMRMQHETMGEDKYRPCPSLEKYVEAGWLGRKTGRGFDAYPSRWA